MTLSDAWGMTLFMACGAMLPMFFFFAMDSVTRPTIPKRVTIQAIVSFVVFLIVFRAFIWVLT